MYSVNFRWLILSLTTRFIPRVAQECVIMYVTGHPVVNIEKVLEHVCDLVMKFF